MTVTTSNNLTHFKKTDDSRLSDFKLKGLI